MKQTQQIEIIAVIAVYFISFFTVIGPLIGSITGFETSAFTVASLRGELIWQVLTTPQGWLLIIGFFPTVLGYMILRARLAATPVAAYWSE
jgi:ABC-type multidrug transport system fused ATPase/permease subunit